MNSDSADGSGLVQQMDKMSDALYDRFLAVQKIFGEFDILHGHDWHPVPALIRLNSQEWRGRSGKSPANRAVG